MSQPRYMVVVEWVKNKLMKGEKDNLFKPEKQNVVENETMKLKQMIASSLKANVKEP